MQTSLTNSINIRLAECGVNVNAKGLARVHKQLLLGRCVAVFAVGRDKKQRELWSFRRK